MPIKAQEKPGGHQSPKNERSKMRGSSQCTSPVHYQSELHLLKYQHMFTEKKSEHSPSSVLFLDSCGEEIARKRPKICSKAYNGIMLTSLNQLSPTSGMTLHPCNYFYTGVHQSR